MYYAIYRKYRPMTFDEVEGQKAVTETLKNQVISRKIGHAYLLTGTRGTGKTTCAKIFARAINCEHPVNGNPCNQCPTCKGLLEGSNYSVIEMDAASNNGVADVRNIIDEIIYPPIDATYKVYIIDEVHMLSMEAFNALLKTIEEPPEHAVFILATTEIQKVPETIKSRCQRFDLTRLTRQELTALVNRILKKENKKLTPGSVDTIVTLSDGSARDSLSILEKVINVEDEAKVKEILGVCDQSEFFELSEALITKNLDSIYRIVDRFYNSSKEFRLLCSDLTEFYRKLLIAKTARNPEELLGIDKVDAQLFVNESKKYSIENIIYIMNQLKDTYELLRYSTNKRVDTEVCFVRCAFSSLSSDQNAILSRLSDLEKNKVNVAHDFIPSPKQETKPVKTAATVQVQKEEIPEVRHDPAPDKIDKEPEEPQKPVTPVDSSDDSLKEFLGFNEVIHQIKSADMILGLCLEKNSRALINSNEILLVFDKESSKELAQKTENEKKIKDALRNLHLDNHKLKMTIGNYMDYISTPNNLYDGNIDSLFV